MLTQTRRSGWGRQKRRIARLLRPQVSLSYAIVWKFTGESSGGGVDFGRGQLHSHRGRSTAGEARSRKFVLRGSYFYMLVYLGISNSG
jgi:hypothetical protein